MRHTANRYVSRAKARSNTNTKLVDMPDLEYRVLSIENLSHSLNIPEGYTAEDLKGKLLGKNEYKASYSTETSTVAIDVRSQLQLKEDEDRQHLKLFHIEVRTIYHIPNLQQFFIDNGDEIRPEIMDQLLVLAIAHTRGVQSTIISGTPIAKTLIQG